MYLWRRRGLRIVCVFASGTGAYAGGFDRYDQDISLLFDPAPTVIDMLGSAVYSSSSYDSVNGTPEDVPLIDDFFAGSMRLKFTPTKSTSCLLHAGQPFGTDIDHGSNWSFAAVVTSQKFRVDEYGLSCSYAVAAPGGSFRLIAGITRDLIEFEQQALTPNHSGTADISQLNLEGETISWRAGFGYELPTLGMVATLMYYAPITFDLDGRLKSPFIDASVAGAVEFPQAVEANIQAIVTPSWLAGASLKWSDWSALQNVSVLNASDTGMAPAGTELINLRTFFRDGLTASIFLGHAIDHQWSIWTRVAWDRGVTTGWTEHTQSWSLFGGLKYKLSKNIDLSANLGIIWLSSGAITTQKQGGPYDATFDDDIAIVPQTGLTFRF